MAGTSNAIYIGKSKKYKYVSIEQLKGELVYRGRVGKQYSNRFKTEREAAIFADMALINQGREPVNIFVRKPQTKP